MSIHLGIHTDRRGWALCAVRRTAVGIVGAVDAADIAVSTPSGAAPSITELLRSSGFSAASACVGPDLWCLEHAAGIEVVGGGSNRVDSAAAATDERILSTRGVLGRFSWRTIIDEVTDADCTFRIVAGVLRTLMARLEERSSLRIEDIASATLVLSPDLPPDTSDIVAQAVRAVCGVPTLTTRIWEFSAAGAFAFIADGNGERALAARQRWEGAVEERHTRCSCEATLHYDEQALRLRLADGGGGSVYSVAAAPRFSSDHYAVGAALWGATAAASGLQIEDVTAWRPVIGAVGSRRVLSSAPAHGLAGKLSYISIDAISTAVMIDPDQAQTAGPGDWFVAVVEPSTDANQKVTRELRIEAMLPGPRPGATLSRTMLTADRLAELDRAVAVSVYRGDSTLPGLVRLNSVSGELLKASEFLLTTRAWVPECEQHASAPPLPEALQGVLLTNQFQFLLALPIPVQSITDWVATTSRVVLVALTRAAVVCVPGEVAAASVSVAVLAPPDLVGPIDVTAQTGLIISKAFQQFGHAKWRVYSFKIQRPSVYYPAGRAVNVLVNDSHAQWTLRAGERAVLGEVLFSERSFGLRADLKWDGSQDTALAPVGGYWTAPGDGHADRARLCAVGVERDSSGAAVVLTSPKGSVNLVSTLTGQEVTVKITFGDGLRAPYADPFKLAAGGNRSFQVERRFARDAVTLQTRSVPRVWCEVLPAGISRQLAAFRTPAAAAWRSKEGKLVAAVAWRFEVGLGGVPDPSAGLVCCLPPSSGEVVTISSLNSLGYFDLPTTVTGAGPADVQVSVKQSSAGAAEFKGDLAAVEGSRGRLRIYASPGALARALGQNLAKCDGSLYVRGPRVPDVKFDISACFQGAIFCDETLVFPLRAAYTNKAKFRFIVAPSARGQPPIDPAQLRVRWRPSGSVGGVWDITSSTAEPPEGYYVGRASSPAAEQLQLANPSGACTGWLAFVARDMEGFEAGEQRGVLELVRESNPPSHAEGQGPQSRVYDSIELKLNTRPNQPGLVCGIPGGADASECRPLEITIKNPLPAASMIVERVRVRATIRGARGSRRELAAVSIKLRSKQSPIPVGGSEVVSLQLKEPKGLLNRIRRATEHTCELTVEMDVRSAGRVGPGAQTPAELLVASADEAAPSRATIAIAAQVKTVALPGIWAKLCRMTDRAK